MDSQELRKKAEKIYYQDASTDLKTDNDSEKLIEDLRVHQIELELQNQELRDTANKLEVLKDQYADLFNHSTVGYVVLDNIGIITKANTTFIDLIQNDMDDVLLKPFSSFVYQEDRHVFLSKFQSFFNQPQGKRLELRLVASDASVLHVEIIGRHLDGFPSLPIKQKNNKFIIVSLHDISTLKQVEQANKKNEEIVRTSLNETEQLLEGAYSILKHSDFVKSAKNIFESAKKITGAQSGYVALLSDDGAENEVLFLDAGGLPCTVNPELPMPIRGLRSEAYALNQVVYDNDFHNSDWMKYMPDGHVKLDNVMFAPLTIDGKVKGIMGLANKPGPFTEKDAKMARAFGELAAIALLNSRLLEDLNSSLKEKETLLQEIHHRVKNNMAVVSGLLSLQANSIEDKQLKDTLLVCKNRVLSISSIHEMLYQSENLSSINLKTYLSKLAGALSQNYTIDQKVNLKIETEDVVIGVKQASPIGLIVNELITNSYKYAFPDIREGEIRIKLQKVGNQIQLEYMDNGIGLPKDFNWQETKSMGLKLVKMLSENQLDGSIDLDNTNRTQFTIKFSLE